jgi:GT2 family glycosyltransferase
MATVSAIIPTWNRADLLQAILTNLARQTRPPEQVIVVDNGSSDATSLVTRNFPVDSIVFPENRGFAVAVNEGIRQAKGDWLLIVNNDVVLDPEWLERLLQSAEEENALFAVGKLLRPDGMGVVDGSWDLVSRAAYAWRCGYGRPDGTVWSTRRRISFAPMTAALFRRDLFDQIGLLEERFESYYEDVDFGIRCMLAGVEGIYDPAAIALHMSKTTFGKNDYRVMFLSARNQVLLLAKYYPRETLRRFAWPILVGQILAVVAAGRHGHFLTALRGKWQGLRQWREIRKGAELETGRRPTQKVEAVEKAFARSESEIRRLQKQIGFDPYWRLYFRLVRG